MTRMETSDRENEKQFAEQVLETAQLLRNVFGKEELIKY